MLTEMRKKQFHLERYGVTSLVSDIFHLLQLFLGRRARIHFSMVSQLKCGDFHIYLGAFVQYHYH